MGGILVVRDVKGGTGAVYRDAASSHNHDVASEPPGGLILMTRRNSSNQDQDDEQMTSTTPQAELDRNGQHTPGARSAGTTSGPRRRSGQKRPAKNDSQDQEQSAKRRRTRSNASRGRTTPPEGIIELALRQNTPTKGAAEAHALALDEVTLSELEAQGFTEDEAYQLIHVSHRIANSRETREAEAIIRRLRFNRWLFEQGKLSEFSA